MGPGIQEATPLVHNGVMYLPNPSDLLQAMNAATGELLWEYKRALPEDLTKHVPVPSINRNLAIYGNNIIDTSADDFVFAVDAASGKLAWEQRIQDYRELSAQETSGPIIARGKIFSTRGCEPKGGPRCLRHHRARRAHRQRNMAHPHHPQTRRARRRNLGRHSRCVSAGTSAPGWCRATTPNSNLLYHRNFGHFARAEIHARRQ